MDGVKWFQWAVVLLIAGRWLAELFLERVNRRHVLKHASEVPEAYREVMDLPTYERSVEYTLAKNRFNQVEGLYQTGMLLLVLFCGGLPWSYRVFLELAGPGVWSAALYLFVVGLLFSALSLPLDAYGRFKLEARFGFNTTNLKTWILDRIKAGVIGAVLCIPLLAVMLKLLERLGQHWWLVGWAVMVLFQLLVMVFAPAVILPLFNKFTPLREGALRDRLLGLASRAGFATRGIRVMDGSRRSTHSNAFFTGFGRFRRIVLFDTLIEQLSEAELESVLAHEIGHFKKHHIVKMTGVSMVLLFAGFFVLGLLVKQPGFYQAFGFHPGNVAPAFLLFGLLSGSISFWLGPIMNRGSRKQEFEADRYAAEILGTAKSLITGLRRLNEKNLSNLMPHPFYSGFYYSHPTLLEREAALEGVVVKPRAEKGRAKETRENSEDQGWT